MTALPSTFKPSEPVLKSRVLAHIYAVMLATTGLYYGYGIGMFNNFFEHFIGNFGIDMIEESHRADQVSANLSTFFALGCLASCFMGSYIYKVIGRSNSLLGALAGEIIITCLMVIKSLPCYYVLRFFSGFIGYFWTFLAPVMMEEILPPELEAQYSPFFTAMISLGVLVSYSFCEPICGIYWRLVVLAPLLTEIPKFVFFVIYKIESPKWMAENGKSHAEMVDNCRLLYTPEAAINIVQTEIQRVDKSNYYSENQKAQKERSIQETRLQSRLFSFLKKYKLQLLVVILTNLLNQFSGGELLELYSSSIFIEEKIKGHNWLTIILGVISVLAGIFVFFVTPLWGKRNMLIAGFYSLMISYTILIGGIALGIKIGVIAGIFGGYFAYCISLGGARFGYNAKLVPGAALSICSILERALSCVFANRTKHWIVVIKPIGLFFIAHIFTTIGTFLFMAYAVDTENKSEEQITEEFSKKSFFS